MCRQHDVRTRLRREGTALVNVEAARGQLIDDDARTGRTAVIGFCMGGGFALLAAPRGFDAAAANYGKPPGNAGQALAPARSSGVTARRMFPCAARQTSSSGL